MGFMFQEHKSSVRNMYTEQIYKQLWKHIVKCQSKESPILSNDTSIKILSLFNFLCYLLSVDTVLIPAYVHEKPLRNEDFGYCFDGVFYVDSAVDKTKLI